MKALTNSVVLARLSVIGTLIFIIAMPVVFTFLAIEYRRTGKHAVPLFIASSVVIGFLGGGVLVWSLVPREWGMSFWTTLAASVDSDKYGHPIEHTAENIVAMVAFGCMSGALISGAVAATTAKLRARFQHS